MRPSWPANTVFSKLVLNVEQDRCEQCGSALHVCDHRQHRFYTLKEPVEMVCRLAHCGDRDCPARSKTLSPQAEQSLVLPRSIFGWDVFCWVGHRRFKRHWSIPQIQTELQETYHIPLSTETLRSSLLRYQTIIAARQQDPMQLAQAYRHIKCLTLTIDGLQPEKGHETLYVVRELNAKRVWFAEPLLSSSEDEIRRLFVRAHQWADALKIPVWLWISDKQDAFVKGIAKEFSGVPHRYCANHFLRDLAKPMLEKDSHAKVQMRAHVRGLRTIEREVRSQSRQAQEKAESPPPKSVDLPSEEPASNPDVVPTFQEIPVAGASGDQAISKKEEVSSAIVVSTFQEVPVSVTSSSARSSGKKEEVSATMPVIVQATPDKDGQIVLDYCAALRGILNDDQGGPLRPPGLRMAEGLRDVLRSLKKNLALNKPGAAHQQMATLAERITVGLADVQEDQKEIKKQVKEIKRVAATLEEKSGSNKDRRTRYEKLQEEYEGKSDSFSEHLSRLMGSFVDGLFVWPKGKKSNQELVDNLDLERWFRMPKGHERRIHGHRHAGMRIVQEGPTLALTLDAHANRNEPFTAAELLPFRSAKMPQEQLEALQRRKVMRQARSKKTEHPPDKPGEGVQNLV